jgi:hypothetical protein
MSEINKVDIFQERSFAKRLGASFSFLRENAKPFFKFGLIFILPVLVFYNLFFCLLMGQVFKAAEVSYFTPHTVFLFLGWLFFLLLLLMVSQSFYFALLKLYQESENRLVGLKFSDMMKVMKSGFLKAANVMLLCILVFGFLFYMKLWVGLTMTRITEIVLFFVAGIPLLFLFPTYFISGLSFWKSVFRSFKLGYRYWWSLLGIWLVLNLIASFITLIVAFPYFIALNVESTFYQTSSNFTIPMGYQILIYVLSLIMNIATVISQYFVIVGLTYQYGHATTHKKSVMVVNNIEDVEQSFDILRKE